jgi:hypothetical protein
VTSQSGGAEGIRMGRLCFRRKEMQNAGSNESEHPWMKTTGRVVLLSEDVDESVEVLATYGCSNQNIVADGIRKCNAVSKECNGLIQDTGVAKGFEQDLSTRTRGKKKSISPFCLVLSRGSLRALPQSVSSARFSS